MTEFEVWNLADYLDRLIWTDAIKKWRFIGSVVYLTLEGRNNNDDEWLSDLKITWGIRFEAIYE